MSQWNDMPHSARCILASYFIAGKAFLSRDEMSIIIQSHGLMEMNSEQLKIYLKPYKEKNGAILKSQVDEQIPRA